MPQLVTLAEAKAVLQSPDSDDGLVSELIERASAAVESYTRRCILHASLVDLLSGGSKALVLRYRPVVEVAQVVDLESQQAVDSEEYAVDRRAGLDPAKARQVGEGRPAVGGALHRGVCGDSR